MPRFILMCFVLSLIFTNCSTKNISIHEEYYARLDAIRDNKEQELLHYMDFVKERAAQIENDPVMKQLFVSKGRLYQQQINKQLENSDKNELYRLRDAIENRYIEKYLLFYDILFINPQGNVFYTVRKQADYHKNIFEGKLSQTALAAHLRENPTQKFVDFQNYEISGEPSAFFIEPHWSGSDLVGWFVLQFSINKINDIFSVEDGLGRTGEVFLVNQDCYMLTDSKFLAGSTVLKKHLSKKNIQSKFEEDEGHKVVIDYRGYRSITSFKVVSVLGSKWLLIAKIDEDELITEKYKRNRKESRAVLLKAIGQQHRTYRHTGRRVAKQVEVDMDEFKRAAAGEILYTHGVSSCTAFLISLKGDFAYLAHISARDRIYGGNQTDLIRRMLKRIDEFDVVKNDKRELEVVIVSPRLSQTEGLIDSLVDWGIFLSQIKLVHNPEARYANLSHNYSANETLVEWTPKKVSDEVLTICVDMVKSLGDIKI